MAFLPIRNAKAREHFNGPIRATAGYFQLWQPILQLTSPHDEYPILVKPIKEIPCSRLYIYIKFLKVAGAFHGEAFFIKSILDFSSCEI